MEPSSKELDRHTVEALVDHVGRRGERITYGDLAKVVERSRGSSMHPRGFHGALGRIQHYCDAVGLPPLSLMVARKDGPLEPSVLPFYREYHPEADDLTDDEIIEQAVGKCAACADWGALLEIVCSNDPAITPEAAVAYAEGRRAARAIADEMRRHPQARAACLTRKGACCSICGQEPEEKYGAPGVVHVHDLRPPSDCDEERKPDPEGDLIPVCPSCHAALHAKKQRSGLSDVFSPDEVRAQIGRRH